jgi:hypothetical protein
VKLVEEAQALLSHSAPRATLDEIQLRAMRALVGELKRRKHALVARPQKTSPESKYASSSTAERESAQKSAPESEHSESEHQSEVEPNHPLSHAASGQSVESEFPRRRGRHVPAAVRRPVFERDEKALHFRRRLGAPPPASLRARRRGHGEQSHGGTAGAFTPLNRGWRAATRA